jgi:hypothetical protein
MADIKMSSALPSTAQELDKLMNMTLQRTSITDFEMDDWLLLRNTAIFQPHICNDILFGAVHDKETPELFTWKLESARLGGLKFMLYSECKRSDMKGFKEIDPEALLRRAIEIGDEETSFLAERWLKRISQQDPRVTPMTDEQLISFITKIFECNSTNFSCFDLHAPSARFIDCMVKAIDAGKDAEWMHRAKLLLRTCSSGYNGESHERLPELATKLPGSIGLHFSRTNQVSKYADDGSLVLGTEPKAFTELSAMLPVTNDAWCSLARFNPDLSEALCRITTFRNCDLVAPHKVFLEYACTDEKLEARLEEQLNQGNREEYFRLLCPNGQEHPDIKFPAWLARMYCDAHFPEYCAVVMKLAAGQGLTIRDKDGVVAQYKVLQGHIDYSAALADVMLFLPQVATVWESCTQRPQTTFVYGNLKFKEIPLGKGKFKKVTELSKDTDDSRWAEVRFPHAEELEEPFRKHLASILVCSAGVLPTDNN